MGIVPLTSRASAPRTWPLSRTSDEAGPSALACDLRRPEDELRSRPRGGFMGWHMDDWSWGGWLMMTAVMVAFWGLVAWLVVVAIRGSRASTRTTPDPERILAERFAAG